MIDISAVVTLHREGLLANASLESVARARAFAERSGLRVETIAILDSADQVTSEYLKARTDVDKILNVSYGDPGLARNTAIQSARGKWVSLLDGDDLWAENWLVAAHNFAESEDRPVIVHAQATLYFGLREYVALQPDMDDEDFDLTSLAISNCWTVLAFARRTTYERIPFPARNLKCQIGFEDWSWNLQTIACGFIHRCVPNSLHFVRVKNESVVRSDIAAGAQPARTTLFRDILSHRDADATTRKPRLA